MFLERKVELMYIYIFKNSRIKAFVVASEKIVRVKVERVRYNLCKYLIRATTTFF